MNVLILRLLITHLKLLPYPVAFFSLLFATLDVPKIHAAQSGDLHNKQHCMVGSLKSLNIASTHLDYMHHNNTVVSIFNSQRKFEAKGARRELQTL